MTKSRYRYQQGPPMQTGVFCERFGKERLTKSQGKKLAKSQQRKSGYPIEAYQCRACGGWHVGARRKM